MYKKFIYFILNIFFSDKFIKNKAVVLMYHSVDDKRQPFSVGLKNFERQMNYLKINNFNVISQKDLFACIVNKKIPSKTVVITFDDGYRDNYLKVFPIIKNLNFPITIFATSSLVEGESSSGAEMLKLQDINEMQTSGLVEFGSHSHNHVKLSHLTEDEVNFEMLESKTELKKIVNSEVISVAYPFGRYNDMVKRVAKKYYSYGFSVEKGIISVDSDLMSMRRNCIDCNTSFIQFKGIVRYGRL